MTEQRRIDLDRIPVPVPTLRAKEVRRFPAKIFKSGNSLALRLPAGIGLQAGMEMELRVEDGESFSFQPSDRPKRKFDIAKVAGSARDLQPIANQDRLFAERPLLWSGSAAADGVDE